MYKKLVQEVTAKLLNLGKYQQYFGRQHSAPINVDKIVELKDMLLNYWAMLASI